MAVLAQQPLPIEKIAQDLGRLRNDRSRLRYLKRRRVARCSALVQKLIESSRANLRVDAKQALAFAEAALVISRRLPDQNDFASSLRARANALYLLGKNRAALKCHSQALEIFSSTKNHEQQARTLSASLQPLILVGEYQKALKAARLAKTLFTRLGDKRHLAHLEINIANIYHRQDRFEQALVLYQGAYEMLLLLRDSEGLAVALYNISVCLIALNDFARALSTYERSREMCVEQAMPLLVGQADYNIAYLYYLRGDYAGAIRLLQATRAASEKNGDAHILALCFLDLSEIYLGLNLSGDAAEMADAGYSRFEKLGMGYEKARSLANHALALTQKGENREALKQFAQARAAFHREKNRVWPSLIDLYCALVYFNEGRLDEARSLCQKSIRFFRSSSISGKTVLCSLLLARIELAARNPRLAAKLCAEALRKVSRSELPAQRYESHFLMGQAYRALGNFNAASSSYEAAREALEALRSTLHKDELKIAFMKNKSEVYECLVELLLQEGEQDSHAKQRAFQYIESAKSRALMDLMERRPQGSSADIVGEGAGPQRIRNLRKELNWYYHRIEEEQLRHSENSAAQIARLQQQAKRREKDILSAMRDIPQAESDSTLFSSMQVSSLPEIQSALGEDSVLVEYFAIHHRFFAAVVNRNEIEIVPLGSVSKISDFVQMLRFQFSKLTLGSDYVRQHEKTLLQSTQKHLHELHRELIAPLAGHLQAKHLVVVPHGILHSVPFHALFDGQDYLIDRFSISYSPSASIYRLCCNLDSTGAHSSLIMGVADELAPSIEDEIKAVAAEVPLAEFFSGPEATEAVLREKGSRSRWIHIATHGKFRQDNPLFSGIRLGDSYLSLFDLEQFRLPADLLTLSGCSTGLNIIGAGDEPLGLIRGLLAAGTRSLLLSLWDVHDRSTTQFMQSFYHQLSAGEPKASAFQWAVRETRDVYQHPYYWAPFFLVGQVLES